MNVNLLNAQEDADCSNWRGLPSHFSEEYSANEEKDVHWINVLVPRPYQSN